MIIARRNYRDLLDKILKNVLPCYDVRNEIASYGVFADKHVVYLNNEVRLIFHVMKYKVYSKAALFLFQENKTIMISLNANLAVILNTREQNESWRIFYISLCHWLTKRSIEIANENIKKRYADVSILHLENKINESIKHYSGLDMSPDLFHYKQQEIEIYEPI